MGCYFGNISSFLAFQVHFSENSFMASQGFFMSGFASWMSSENWDKVTPPLINASTPFFGAKCRFFFL